MFVFEYIDLFLLKKIYLLENDKGNFSFPLSSVYNRTFNEVGFQIRFLGVISFLVINCGPSVQLRVLL